MTVAPKTIVFIDHTAIWSGGEIALFQLICQLDATLYRSVIFLGADGPLADRLRERGFETHIIALDSAIGETRKDSVGGGSLLRLKALFGSLGYCLKLRKELRKVRPEIVQTNSLKSDLLGGIAARLAGLTLIWNIQDRIAEDYLPAKVVYVFRKLTRWIPHYVVANSRATLDSLQLTKAAQRNARVVHCGVNIPTLKNFAPSENLRIGIIGRLSPWKGQHIFLESAAVVHRRFPEAKFQIIGGPFFGEELYAEKLHRQVAELELGDCVEFLGFRSDVADLVQRLDVVVHASTSPEPFGLVIAEAMAAQRAVVATEAGGVPEIIENGVTGWLVPMGDSVQMAGAIIGLLKDEKKRHAMGLAARLFAESYLGVTRQASEMTAFYDEILAAR